MGTGGDGFGEIEITPNDPALYDLQTPAFVALLPMAILMRAGSRALRTTTTSSGSASAFEVQLDEFVAATFRRIQDQDAALR